MNEAPTWEESTAVATDEAPRWEDSTPVDIPHWDDSTPVGESTSDTPATDSALKKLNRLAQTPSPDWMQGFEGAVKDLVKGVPEMAMQLPKAAYQGVKFAAGGPQERAQVSGEVLKQAVPMGEQIAQGIQQPIGSKEWWSSALQMGMMAAPALELLRPAEAIKPPIQEGATDAIKRSDAQVQARTTPLGIEARPGSGEPPTSYSDYDVREAQGETAGGQLPQEPVPSGESVAPETQKAPHEPELKSPKLLSGEKQGDLISSTQQEPYALVGEKVIDFESRAKEAQARLQSEEEARLKAEHEQGLLEDLQEYQERGGDEFLTALRQEGGLPAKSSPRQKFHGELQDVREAYQGRGKERIKYADIFRKDAPDPDVLAARLRARGFDVQSDTDVLQMAKDRITSGKPIYGMEARGQALEEASLGDAYAMGVRSGQPDVASKILRTVKTASEVIQKSFGKTIPGEIKPPTLNLESGSAKPPPPNSIFGPDTPPGDDPVPIYATRINNTFKRWWEKFWPRDLAVSRVAPDSPVITEHQRIIKSQMDYMSKFSKEPWWRALRGRSNEELIDAEDRAVKEYRFHVENGVDHKRAYNASVNKMPKYLQDIVRHRESRVPIEESAADELGVDRPKHIDEPYIARLTNEEGKDVVDLNPRISNIGKQIRTTIGSFDNSRVHATMKDGIAAGTQYEPVARAVWLRELTSQRLEATANLVRSLKQQGVLFDDKKAAYDASPKGRISLVRGLGGKDYWARSPEEAVFLEQNISSVPRSPFGKIQQLANTYVRNPSLVNPLPHVTKNMFFKHLMARVNNFTFRSDVAEFARSTPSELKARFDKVMPFIETGEKVQQLTAREVGTWAEKTLSGGLKINNPSSQFIFAKADPAMRYSLWKSYVRKGMTDQEAANHVWIDLIRYDANSGGMNFWKSIPFNFFVPWRTGTYVTIAKALTSHPIRTLAFIGAVEYLREIRYRKKGQWTHLPTDYIDAPLAEAVDSATKVKDLKSAGHAAQMSAATAATTLIFGPGGGQAPSTIKDAMSILQNDPQNKARVMNMFWGLSQIYNIPREWQGFRRDGNTDHLVNILTSAAISEHAALKYEPRRLMKWLPEWMPGLQKSELVRQAEQIQSKIRERAEKGKATYETRHGVAATYERTPEEQQLEELARASGIRPTNKRASRLSKYDLRPSR